MSMPTREEVLQRFGPVPADDPEIEARSQHILEVLLEQRPKMQQQLRLENHGLYESRVLGLDVQVDDDRLRFYAGTALLLESTDLIARLQEMCDAAQRRAEEETRRREEADQRREEETRRREEAEQENARLRKELERLKR